MNTSGAGIGATNGFHGRWVLPAAGGLLALATIAGALGAHALAGRWSAGRLGVYDTAVRYQFYQSLGLLAMGVVAERRVARRFAHAPRTLFVGIVAFCGSLYALSLGAPPGVVGWMTPFGGALLILGWLQFAYDVWRV